MYRGSTRLPFCLLGILLATLSTGCLRDGENPLAPEGPRGEALKPPPSNAPREIAVHVNSTSKGNTIRAMAADGSNVGTIIAVSDPLPVAVSWNRLGTMLAYENNSAIYRVNADGTGNTLLLSAAQCADNCWRMAWSPSTTIDEVAVVNSIDDPSDVPMLFLVPGSGGAPTLLYSGVPGTSFDDVAWSPDGSQLAVSVTDPGPPRQDMLVIIQRSGGAATTALSYLGMSGIDWSRQTGDLIAMDVVDVGGDGVSRDMYIFDLSTPGVPPQFVRALARDPSFSPDNSYLAYTTMGGGRGGVFKHNLSTGAATRLGDGRAADWKR